MFNELKKSQNLIQILLILLIIAVGSYVLGLVWGVISQFMNILVVILMSWLVSFLLSPIVSFIQHKLKLAKTIATIGTYLLLTIFIITIGFVYAPLVNNQIIVLTSLVTNYLNTAPAILNNLNGPLVSQVENSIAFIPSIAQFLFSAFVVLILSFYFIIDQEKINAELTNLFPRTWHKSIEFIKKVIDETFVSFFRVQLFYGVSTALVTWLVMAIFGTGFALSVAFLAGIFAIIPLIGPLFSIVLPILVALLSNRVEALIVGLILFIAQQIIFNVIGPKLLGKAFSLHPAIILISLLIGLQFAGALGAIFAIPVLGIGVVIIRKFGLEIVAAINRKST